MNPLSFNEYQGVTSARSDKAATKSSEHGKELPLKRSRSRATTPMICFLKVPWPSRKHSVNKTAHKTRYERMTLAEIKALPVTRTDRR